MKTFEPSDWVIAALAPVAVLLVAVPLFGALQHASSRLPAYDAGTPWRTEIEQVETALAQRDASGAIRAWHIAYTGALASRRWEGMIEAGDAYLRIGEAVGARRSSEPKAREAYLIALFRARRDGDLEGVLRAAEAFAGLGDREVVRQCLAVAEGLVTSRNDDAARERVRQVTERLSTPAAPPADAPL